MLMRRGRGTLVKLCVPKCAWHCGSRMHSALPHMALLSWLFLPLQGTQHTQCSDQPCARPSHLGLVATWTCPAG